MNFLSLLYSFVLDSFQASNIYSGPSTIYVQPSETATGWATAWSQVANKLLAYPVCVFFLPSSSNSFGIDL
jgi:hypothetical protein